MIMTIILIRPRPKVPRNKVCWPRWKTDAPSLPQRRGMCGIVPRAIKNVLHFKPLRPNGRPTCYYRRRRRRRVAVDKVQLLLRALRWGRKRRHVRNNHLLACGKLLAKSWHCPKRHEYWEMQQQQQQQPPTRKVSAITRVLRHRLLLLARVIAKPLVGHTPC